MKKNIYIYGFLGAIIIAGFLFVEVQQTQRHQLVSFLCKSP